MFLFGHFLFIFITLFLIQLNYLGKAKPVFQIKQSQYETKYYKALVDNFSYRNDSATFQLKYLISTQNWAKGNAILFYCGNEDSIELFANNSGFIWELGEQLSAMVVFAEHRYYGTSLPFGNLSFNNSQYFGYLSAAQALADYSRLVTHLKSTIDGANRSAVIAFGGSYGGMLAAWMRQKYPNIVAGSLASSAPIAMVGDLVNCNHAFQVLTRAFITRGSQSCVDNVHRFWSIIDNMTDQNSLTQLTNVFHICQPLRDAKVLQNYFFNAIFSMAVTNYPYACNFEVPLPAWPVTAFCKPLSVPLVDHRQLLDALHISIQTFTNSTGKAKCLSLTKTRPPTIYDVAWNIQTCTELPMPLCIDGVTDMFYKNGITKEEYNTQCQQSYGVQPRWKWVETVYGNHNFNGASNIIFSNGMLDPWAAGGILETKNKNILVIKILDGAHHIDLRSSHPLDTPEIRFVRQLEKMTIKKYIEQWKTLL